MTRQLTRPAAVLDLRRGSEARVPYLGDDGTVAKMSAATSPSTPCSLFPAPCLLGLLLLLLLAPLLRAQTPTVLKLTLHDTIQPVTAGYLERGLAAAAEQHDAAVLISLGTPGGLLSSTRSIVTAIEHSPVPVIVYISPAGSRAGSAGFFLLEAADIAAMAPGTNAGASHPIVEGGPADPTLKEKIENDTAAFLRSYVTRRNRNPAAAEDAVRNSKSYSDSEALDLKLIDTIAADDHGLLASLDGKTIHRLDGSALTLHLTLNGQPARIVGFPPSLRERLLTHLASPDLAVLLLVLGALLIYLEFNVPGTIVPGALGTLLLLLGAFGLDLLPIRHTAVALLVAALVLMLLEAKFSSHGVLGFTGVCCLVFGLATLVDGPIAELRVHPATALAAGIGFGSITFFLAWIALKARRNKVLTGPDAMLGHAAIAITALAPAGEIEVRGELWHATLRDPLASLPAGAAVIVRHFEQQDALRLIVEPAKPEPAKPAPANADRTDEPHSSPSPDRPPE
jgi:membrane-bound serine protease (ClpP class)